MSTVTHPFGTLQKSEQLQIVKELRDSELFRETFSCSYSKALNFIVGKTAEIDEMARPLMEAMNAKASELKFDRDFGAWKQEITPINGAVFYASMAARGISAATLAMGGLTLWSFRNSKALAAANGCALLALVILGNSVANYTEGLIKVVRELNALEIENCAEFSSKIDGIYEGIAKSIFIFSSYFKGRRAALGKAEHQGLQLLRDDISAIRALPEFITLMQFHMMSGNDIRLEYDSEMVISAEDVKAFFQRLEKLAHNGKGCAFGGTLVGMAYLYLAYLNRAYLMVIAGLTFTIMNGALFLAARSYEMGAAKVHQSDDGDLIQVFNRHVAGGLFPKVVNTYSLQKAVTIPLGKILKLIPA